MTILSAVTNAESLVCIAFAATAGEVVVVVEAQFLKFLGPATLAAEKEDQFFAAVFTVTTVTNYFLFLKRVIKSRVSACHSVVTVPVCCDKL